MSCCCVAAADSCQEHACGADTLLGEEHQPVYEGKGGGTCMHETLGMCASREVSRVVQVICDTMQIGRQTHPTY